MIREAVILAGGLGTRLRDAIGDIPKPMAPVRGKPFLEYQMKYLAGWGIRRVVLSVGYKREMIRHHFGSSFLSMELAYAEEHEPLGTGGGLRNAFQQVNEPLVIILNGDTFFNVNLSRLLDFHRKCEADASVVLRYVEDASRYGLVRFDDEYRITGFSEKQTVPEEGYINGGMYLMKPNLITRAQLPDKFSLECDFFTPFCNRYRFYAMRCYSFFLDIGVPEDYRKAQDEFASLTF
ncbi:MAG: nucleotidyltransferase family protein [Bacteroidales bacterium]|nr:nucleotidyltransferase family protein [Bacteroidales bacterium]